MNKIDRKETVKKICKFLRENNALERFCYNVVSYHHNRIRVPAGLTLKEKVLYIVDHQVRGVTENDYPRLEDFFEDCMTCFSWAKTPEGAAFWSDLHTKWYKMVTGEDY